MFDDISVSSSRVEERKATSKNGERFCLMKFSVDNPNEQHYLRVLGVEKGSMELRLQPAHKFAIRNEILIIVGNFFHIPL